MSSRARYLRGRGRRKLAVDFDPDGWKNPLTRGLEGAWLFNEGAGNVYHDAANFNTPATPTSFSWTKGNFSGAAVTSSTNAGQISAGAGTKIANLRPLSFVCWVNLTTTSDCMFAYKSNDDGGQGWWFALDDSGHPSFAVSTAATDVGAASTTIPALSKWTQMAVTWTGGLASGVQLYTNGLALALSTNQTGSGAFGNDSAVALLLGGVGTLAGVLNPGFGTWTSTTFGGYGAMDHCLLYNRVLTPNEVWQLYVEPFAFLEQTAPHRPFKFTPPAPGGPSGFRAAWAQRNVIIGGGVY